MDNARLPEGDASLSCLPYFFFLPEIIHININYNSLISLLPQKVGYSYNLNISDRKSRI